MRVCEIRINYIFSIFDDVSKHKFISVIVFEVVHHAFKVVVTNVLSLSFKTPLSD
jgi:hypothetical protein